jgi:dihydrofolate reductase
MATVTAHMSMSLDGYVADQNDGVNEVFAWMTGENLKQFLEETTGEVGAVISGRRTSDLAGAWGGQHPVGVPAYVVSHRPPPAELDIETSTVYFVDGVEAAVRQASEAAGDKIVGVAGGDIVRQMLDLGLLDAVRISLVPVLLGEGVPFFPNLGNAPILLSQPKVTEGDGVTHLDYGVVR